MVRNIIKKTENIKKAEKQDSKEGEEKYKVAFKLSRRYELVVIMVFSDKVL